MAACQAPHKRVRHNGWPRIRNRQQGAPLNDWKDDLYESPPEAVTALLRRELPSVIWDSPTPSGGYCNSTQSLSPSAQSAGSASCAPKLGSKRNSVEQ